MPAPGPAAAFATVDLKTRHIPAGRIFSRINKAAFPDPLGFGYNPTRFSDPQVIDPGKRFGVVYLGIAYQSRLSRKINLAVFDRAVTKLRCARVVPLLQANELPAVLRKFRIAIAA